MAKHHKRKIAKAPLMGQWETILDRPTKRNATKKRLEKGERTRY